MCCDGSAHSGLQRLEVQRRCGPRGAKLSSHISADHVDLACSSCVQHATTCWACSWSGCIQSIGALINAAHTPVTFVTHTPAPTLAVQVSEIRCLSHRPAPGACVSSNGAAKGEQVESNISYRGAGMRACPGVPQGRSSRTRSRSGWVQDDMGA